MPGRGAGLTLRDPVTGAGLTVPDDWEEQTGGPWALAARAPRSGPGVVASVNVIAERTTDDLATRSATTLAQERALMPGFVLLDRAETTLAERPAVRTLFSYNLDDAQIVVDQWLVVAGGVATCLSGGSDTFGFPAAAGLLEAIAASLELPGEAETEASAKVPEAELPGLPIEVVTDAAVEEPPQLTLRVGEATVLGWCEDDRAAVLAPDEGVLRRMPAALLPVELATRIPATAAAERPEEPLELPPGVLAAVVATRAVPSAVLPGPDADRLRELAGGLQAWWRLEREGEPVLEGLDTIDGPWRVEPAGELMRLTPVAPRALFAALCAACLGYRTAS
jgi:hypothetical protein